jgi:hypothetical protein
MMDPLPCADLPPWGDDPDERCPHCNVKHGEPCGLETEPTERERLEMALVAAEADVSRYRTQLGLPTHAAEIKRLTAENAVLREHVAAIHNEHRHKLGVAFDDFFKASSGVLALRAANAALTRGGCRQ